MAWQVFPTMSIKKGILMPDSDVDIVLMWVDGADPDWRKEFQKYCHEQGDKSESRFRDWEILLYWFRSVEKCLPWVRKIHFVTYGHLPCWLNTAHPKLNIVSHRDFLDEADLPVFSSRAIECNLHRIKGLSQRFIYFNDDMFVLKNLSIEDFFVAGMPRDLFAMNLISTDITAHMKINNLHVLSRHFDKRKTLIRLFFKWFRPQNGLEFIKSLLLLPWPQFTGFYSHHLPQPFLINTFEKVWELEPAILKKTSRAKFKNSYDVNQFLFKWWQILEGNFVPRTFYNTRKLSLWTYDDVLEAARLLRLGKLEMVCLNDHLSDGSFERSKSILIEAFKGKFPEKSTFES